MLSRGAWGRPPYPILNEIRAAVGMPALKIPGEAKSAAVLAWLTDAGTEKTTAQIARNTKISEHAVRQSLAYLKERGQVEATVEPQWTHGGIWRAVKPM